MESKLVNSLRIFEDLRLGKLRVIVHDDGEPWFVLKDICEILEKTSNSAVTDSANILDESEKGMDIIHTLGGPQEMWTVTEGGLYYLICTSRMPKAKDFRLWVTGTVLVSIRKNNGYLLGQEDLPAEKQAVLGELVKSLAPAKSNPMNLDGITYIAPDGIVFTNREECVDYCRSLREN